MDFENNNQKQKEIFAKNLRYWMKIKNKNQIDLMNDLNLSSSTVSDWYNAKKYPRMGTVQMLADYLGILKSDLVEKNKADKNISRQYYMTPVYGQISAGQPDWAEECIEGRIPIDPDLMGIVNPEEHFFLRVNGESMNKIVKNGAFALIHKQDTVENGEIAVVLVNGFSATLKKFTKQKDLIILEPQSNDESFETQVYDKTTSIKILGKYVGKMEINK